MGTKKSDNRELVARLVEHFKKNRDQYCKSDFKEADTRRDLIDPFFQALGWDVGNTNGVAPQYREVILEDSIEVEGHKKAPDYVFRIGQTPKFFVEAKKPSVAIKSDVGPAYQLRRYAWSANLPLSILTDFEELAVYDCRIKPKPKDKASAARIFYYTFEEYLEKWEEISELFSREAIWDGSFDRFVEKKGGKRGTGTVDEEFLKEIETWREALAKNMALRNPELGIEDLNDSVQRTIDRIIFLRMAEDRGMEPYEQLKHITKNNDIYDSFVNRLCKKADTKYNSGLFDFEKDKTTPKLKVDNKVMKDIVSCLYFPDCPYEFSVISPEILGNVYEQFLGKVIRLTKGHQARVEEKPEVKKAGGVYYTPSYIVDYIVKHTVGKMVEGKSPTQLKGFRVLDMACGSGSFLLGAYQFLLDHCLKWYSEISKRKNKKAIWNNNGEWRLTTSEKKRILKEHIFGVDIDRQAVEVTKLSLLLKVLENENEQTLNKQWQLVHVERALPDLSDNIKCGNSLIGPDYFEGELIHDPEEIKRVNPFDWEREFPEAMKAGGFDCVIGNPPYVRIQAMKKWAPKEVEIYKSKYKTARTGNYDIYVVFVERGLELLNKNGLLGYILPHKFFNSKYGEATRKLIAEGKHLSHVVHFGDNQVFKGATTYTCLLFLSKEVKNKCDFTKVKDLINWEEDNIETGKIDSSEITKKEWNFVVGKGASLFKKINSIPVKLEEIADIFVGLQTSADTVYLFKEYHFNDKYYTIVKSSILGKEIKIESDILKPVIRSGNIGRYWAKKTALILFPYRITDNKAFIIDEDDMRENYPFAWKYLKENKKLLENRENGKFKYSGWYQLYPKNLHLWEQAKILVPYMITRLSAFYDLDNSYFVNVTTGGFGITINCKDINMIYLTGIINSKLMDWYLKKVSTSFHGGYFAANKQYLEQLTIRKINFSDPSDKSRHDLIVKLVDQMLELHKKLAKEKSEQTIKLIKNRIEKIDRDIDKIVYELYGLTKKEIEIVEST